MMKRSERVKLMVKEYMSRKEDGLSNIEIAEEYGVTRQTLYRHLQKIADDNGVARESLLDLPNKQHNVKRVKVAREEKKVEPIELEEKFDTVLNALSELINQMNTIVNEQEEK